MALTPWHVSMKVVTDKRFTYFRSHLLFIVVVLFHQGHCQVYIEVTIRAHCAITLCEQCMKSPGLAERPFGVMLFKRPL